MQKVRRRPHPCYQESLKRLKLEQAHLHKTAPRAWLTYRDAQGEADYKMSVGATAAPLDLTNAASPGLRAHQDPEGHLPKLDSLPNMILQGGVAAVL